MAKRGTLEHQKTIALAELLGIDECFALGVLEAFWHRVAAQFPTGDLAAAKAHLLARSIRYSGDADTLWSALIQAGFIEEREGRPIVHDWAEHADDAVHMSNARRGLLFADGSRPRMSRLPAVEREKIERGYTQREASVRTASAQEAHGKRTDNAQCAHGERSVCALPSHAPPEPCPAPPEPEIHGDDATPSERSIPPGVDPPVRTSPRVSRCELPREEMEQAWDAFLAVYPRRDGDRKVSQGRDRFMRLLAAGEDVGPILDGARLYGEWAKTRGVDRSSLVKQIPTWLNGRCWEEATEAYPADMPPEPPPLRGRGGNASGIPTATMASKLDTLRAELGLVR